MSERDLHLISGALECVHEAANAGVLDPESADMTDEAARQQAAVDTVGDFIANHHEHLDDLEPDATELEEEIDLAALRDMQIESPLHDAMLTTLELGCQQYDPEEGHGGDLDRALNIAGTFWKTHGQDVLEQIVEVDIGDDGPEA